jgi:hypothetical protein
MTLTEVIAGLKEGQAFRREVAGVTDTLRPAGDGRVLHSVYNDRTGSGGEAEISISTINSDRWPIMHWFPC